MEVKFKKKDIVVISVGYLTQEVILEKDSHLFEISSLDENNGSVDIVSLSTRLSITKDLKNIRHATLKEKFLRDGNAVRNGLGIWYVTGDRIISFGDNGKVNTILTHNYNDNLVHKHHNNLNITEVYKNDNVNFKTLLWKEGIIRDLTDIEVSILKSLDTKYKYISRGLLSVYIFENKPTTKGDNFYPTGNGEVGLDIGALNKDLFKSISYTNSPQLISELIERNTI